MLTTDIFNGVPYLVEDTKLYYCVRKNTLEGIREAFQAINASNKDIMNSTVLQIRQYVKPEICSLIFRDIHYKQILVAFLVYT